MLGSPDKGSAVSHPVAAARAHLASSCVSSQTRTSGLSGSKAHEQKAQSLRRSNSGPLHQSALYHAFRLPTTDTPADQCLVECWLLLELLFAKVLHVHKASSQSFRPSVQAERCSAGPTNAVLTSSRAISTVASCRCTKALPIKPVDDLIRWAGFVLGARTSGLSWTCMQAHPTGKILRTRRAQAVSVF